ncbi:hypothetical protein [Verrucosispora sp. WMMD573]|uniref:hypothetical protein n=1 Tax=Verrucosispora sp. WMMD573 TaxID=3015149 RepID=UPI00248B6E90|nr:hypothetical protein [Verrucosispora sp. WMMD573]WBB55807.1 hypothetical protein O7601_06910 [Verrucosispora sp. WMMD573]
MEGYGGGIRSGPSSLRGGEMNALTRQLSGTRESLQMFTRRVNVPWLGEVAVPPPDKLTYYAGIGVLTVLQVIEWPLALVITAGHLLADQHLSGLAKGLGEALESA